MVIYKTTNIVNNKIYIGQDSKNNSKYIGSGHIMKRAIRKYGKNNFQKEIIDFAISKDELNEKEIFWINEYNSRNPRIGYNISSGGGGCLGCKPSLETINKMRLNNIGTKNPMYGKSLPKETLSDRSKKAKKEGTFSGENNPNFKFKIDKNELIEFFIIKNHTIKKIAEYYGSSNDVIKDNLRKFGINKPLSNKYNLNIKEIKKYLNNGLSQVEIGKVYGCSNKAINKFIKNHKNEK